MNGRQVESDLFYFYLVKWKKDKRPPLNQGKRYLRQKPQSKRGMRSQAPFSALPSWWKAPCPYIAASPAQGTQTLKDRVNVLLCRGSSYSHQGIVSVSPLGKESQAFSLCVFPTCFSAGHQPVEIKVTKPNTQHKSRLRFHFPAIEAEPKTLGLITPHLQPWPGDAQPSSQQCHP